MGGVSPSVRDSSWTHRGLLRYARDSMERRLVGRLPDRFPCRHPRSAPVPRGEGEAWCRGSVVRHRGRGLSGPRLVHLGVLDQHLPRTVLQGPEQLLLDQFTQRSVLREAGPMDSRGVQRHTLGADWYLRLRRHLLRREVVHPQFHWGEAQSRYGKADCDWFLDCCGSDFCGHVAYLRRRFLGLRRTRRDG